MSQYRIGFKMRLPGQTAWEFRSHIYDAATREDALRMLHESLAASRERPEYRVTTATVRCSHVDTLVDREGTPFPRPCHLFTARPGGRCSRHLPKE